jgi:DNA-3-methyladenine glycosylase I
MARARCPWAEGDPLYEAYHDREWGVPLHDDRALFELLTLEGAQAGLSWITILRKRDNYRRAFAGFDPARVARFDARRVARLLADPGIVRNRAKVEGTVASARALLKLLDEEDSFESYLWRFVGGRPKENRRRSLKQVPPETEESRALSRDLRRRGFTFVGPTICYAFMQAAGLVNDHLVSCFRYEEVGGRARPAAKPPAGASARA